MLVVLLLMNLLICNLQFYVLIYYMLNGKLNHREKSEYLEKDKKSFDM